MGKIRGGALALAVATLALACGGPDEPAGGGPTTTLPDGEGMLVVGGPALEGTIDSRDANLGSFDPSFAAMRGDQYTLNVTMGPVSVGVKALPNGSRANIIDYVIERAPNGDATQANGHDRVRGPGNECLGTFNTGQWTLRVLTYGGIPSEEQQSTGSTLYRVKAEQGTVCNFDSY
jgi:hypothetical protein